MGRHIGLPMITTSVRISPEFHQLAVENMLCFSEAMRIGISLMLAERGVTEYDNNLNLMRKLNLIREQLEKKSIELEEIKDKVNNE